MEETHTRNTIYDCNSSSFDDPNETSFLSRRQLRLGTYRKIDSPPTFVIKMYDNKGNKQEDRYDDTDQKLIFSKKCQTKR